MAKAHSSQTSARVPVTCEVPPHVSEAWAGPSPLRASRFPWGRCAAAPGTLAENPWQGVAPSPPLLGTDRVCALGSRGYPAGDGGRRRSGVTPPSAADRSLSRACGQVAGSAALPARDAVYN